jgi:hypothetical protein
MKITKKLMCVVVLGLVQPWIGNARDIYQARWQGTAYRTDPATGRVVTQRYSEKDIIQKCAQDNGITDLKALAYVYVASEQNTEVVWSATGATVCEVFQFEYSHTDVVSADNSQTVRQAFIFDEAHGQSVGSLFGREKAKHDAEGNLTAFSYSGSFQFAFPETGTVYSGTFSTGKRINDLVNQ